MKRAVIAALIASTMLAGLARAAPAAPSAADVDARTMDAPYIAVPVVRDGVLVNYVFVTLRLDIAPGVDLWRTREKAHFLRDALVRAAHTGSLVDPERDDALNEAAALAAFRAAAEATLGTSAIRGLTITSSHTIRSNAQAQR